MVQKQGDEQTPKTPVPIQKGVNRLERAWDRQLIWFRPRGTKRCVGGRADLALLVAENPMRPSRARRSKVP